jgi:hypothetical protein
MEEVFGGLCSSCGRGEKYALTYKIVFKNVAGEETDGSYAGGRILTFILNM